MKTFFVLSVVFVVCVLQVVPVFAQKSKKKNDVSFVDQMNEQEKKQFDDLPKREKEIATHILENGFAWPMLNAYEPEDMEVGQFGEIYRDGYSGGSLEVGFGVNQVIDKKNVLIYGSSIWLSGMSTEGLVDDATSTFVGNWNLFYVEGTKTYDTALGTRTVKFLVRPDVDKLRAFLEPFMARLGYRYWKGKVKESVIAKQWTWLRPVAAKYRITDKRVNLKLSDGTSVSVVIDELCEEDQEFVAQELKLQKAKAKDKKK